MPESGEAFLNHARAAADPDGRLPLGGMADWEVFPFEAESLRTRPLTEYAVPEPDRSATPETCGSCRAAVDPKLLLWSDDRFAVIRVARTSLVFTANVLTVDHVPLDDLDGDGHAALGRTLGAAYDAIRALPGVANVHINKWENGKGHLSFTLLARPVGVLQLRGSNLPIWADMLPHTPEEELAARADQVRRALA